MGSAPSALGLDTPGGDLRLPASGLKFSANQLRALNCYVDTLNEEDRKGRISSKLESEVEALVQRIVDGAGQRDPRFRCCHLIALHRGKKMRSRSLEYLVTLDALPALNSTLDCKLQDGPVGYGKVILAGKEADKWEEFLTPSGYLCRDKVVERWVELVARCAHARGGGASRVLGARAAARADPNQYFYLERAHQPPTSNDRRLAIVEGAAWVMVRVGAGEAEAKLMLGARVAGCSASAYSSRVPLLHPLAMLHYTSAQGGYYAVAVGPPYTMVCADRAATWQLWHPALEASLDAHCSDMSTVARIAGALNSLIDRMREGGYKGTLRALSRYAACCALRRRLARGGRLAAAHLSHHLVLVLDDLYNLCLRGGVAGYVYPVERGGVARRGDRDTDWESDTACLKTCLWRLHEVAGEDIPPTPSEALESALFRKWEAMNRESKSAVTAPNYTRRQLRYLCRVANELVRCKSMMFIDNPSAFKANLIQITALNKEAVEDLIHIVAIMLDQARDLYMNHFLTRNQNEFDRELSAYRSSKWSKLKQYYDLSSACLVDALRRDPGIHQEDLSDGINVIRQALIWLYKGAKEDKKYLGPVLKPYLEGLFTASLENSWFLDEFDARKCEKEFDGLKEYCTAVHEGSLEPCLALLDAAKKLSWAKAVVDYLDKFKHINFRLVFPTGDGMAVSYPVKLPSRREHSSARVLTLSRRDKAEVKLRLARRCVLGAFAAALVGDRWPKPKSIIRQESSEEILNSAKSGQYWRSNSKPDVIPSTSAQDNTSCLTRVRRRSRRSRPTTSHGFPEISITDQSDTKSIRRKYHTLRSLVYTEPVENIKEIRRTRSTGSTVRNKESLSRPNILETLDFINGVKDALSVEESGTSDAEETSWSTEDEWLLGQMAPLNLLASRCGANVTHMALGELVPALLNAGKFSTLQELCALLGGAGEGALFALHRLARAARSRSADRPGSSWKIPEAQGSPTEAPQKYRVRPLDYMSGDEVENAPQPPPLPRNTSKDIQIPNRHSSYQPTDRLQHLEQNLNHLEKVNSRLNSHSYHNKYENECYTGIINPIYDINIPKDKFIAKRPKSLGRSFSVKNGVPDFTRYNITMGHRSGGKTNDVLTAINGIAEDTDLRTKSQFFHRSSIVGDSYRSRFTFD